MKQLGSILAWMVLLGSTWLRAQGCDPAQSTWSNPGQTPTFLAVIVGNEDRYATETWSKMADKLPTNPVEGNGPKALHLLYGGRAAEASAVLAQRVTALLADSTFDSVATANGLADLEVGGMAALIEGKLPAAADLLAHALHASDDRLRCRLHVELLLVRYFQAYGMVTPQFAHFNSGFYNYLSDSLGWKQGAPDANAYVVALNTVTQLYRMDAAHGTLYMELLGDLLSKEPNPFNANYLAALAYLRAGLAAGGDAQAVYERKALFALEAPRQSEDRFNRYRFTQLKKALIIDVDSAKARQATFAAQEAQGLQQNADDISHVHGVTTSPITTAFLPTDLGRLPSLLNQSKAEIEAHAAAEKRYAGDVDLAKEVKKDNRFNAFALFLIAGIVGAVIFIARKLMRASKE